MYKCASLHTGGCVAVVSHCLSCLQVNAAVDELAGFSEANHKAMASVARNQLSRVAAEERVRLQDLYHHIAVRGPGQECGFVCCFMIGGCQHRRPDVALAWVLVRSYQGPKEGA